MIVSDGTAPRSLAREAAKGHGGIRLFIADDHPLILESFKNVIRILDQDADIMTFANVPALTDALDHEPRPDLVLVDYSMPGLDSREALAELVTRHAAVPIAIISGHVDPELTRDLLKLGCVGFIPKTMHPNAIHQAIRLMLCGGLFLPEHLLAETQAISASSQPRPAPHSNDFGLTSREFQTLMCLTKGGSNKEIAREM